MEILDILAFPQEELAKLRESVADVRGWLDIKLTTGRYSFGFVLELAGHQMARQYNVHTIYDEIGVLESTSSRPSMTKPPEPFKRGILRGLWHKHHHQARFLPETWRWR